MLSRLTDRTEIATLITGFVLVPTDHTQTRHDTPRTATKWRHTTWARGFRICRRCSDHPMMCSIAQLAEHGLLYVFQSVERLSFERNKAQSSPLRQFWSSYPPPLSPFAPYNTAKKEEIRFLSVFCVFGSCFFASSEKWPSQKSPFQESGTRNRQKFGSG